MQESYKNDYDSCVHSNKEVVYSESYRSHAIDYRKDKYYIEYSDEIIEFDKD